MAGGGNAIRGSRVGAGPMGEAERGEAAPRQTVTYFCSHDHRSVVTFAIEAAVPELVGLPQVRPPGQPGQREPAPGAEDRALQDAPRLREGASQRDRGRRHPRRGRRPPAQPPQGRRDHLLTLTGHLLALQRADRALPRAEAALTGHLLALHSAPVDEVRRRAADSGMVAGRASPTNVVQGRRPPRRVRADPDRSPLHGRARRRSRRTRGAAAQACCLGDAEAPPSRVSSWPPRCRTPSASARGPSRSSRHRTQLSSTGQQHGCTRWTPCRVARSTRCRRSTSSAAAEAG